MSYEAAILLDLWRTPDVLPGGYAVLLTQDEVLSLSARIDGYSLRDTLLILGPGSTTSFGFLFRSPLEGTIVDNALKHGTGTMNIGACRVKADLKEFFSSTGKPRSGMGHAHGFGMGDGYGGDKANPPDKGGRWPTNIAFIHSAGCRVVGTRLVTTGVAHRTNSGGKTFGGTVDKPAMDDMTYGEGGKETIPAYECEAGCPVALLDLQSGDRPSTLTGRGDPNTSHEHPSSATTDSWFTTGAAKASDVYADSGGASRFYPQFQDGHELLEWLIRLVAKDASRVSLV